MSARWQLRHMAPMLAREYGIRPWELDLLTMHEVIRLVLDQERIAELSDPDSKTNKLRKQRQDQSAKVIDDMIKPGR